MNSFKKLLNIPLVDNIIQMIFNGAFSLVVGVFVNIFVVRYFTVEQYGVISYICSYVAIFLVIADAGLENLCIREYSKHQYEKNEIIGSALFVRVLLGLLSTFACIITIWLRTGDKLYLIYMIIYSSTILLRTGFVFRFYFQAHLMAKEYLKYDNVNILINSIIKILFTFTSLDIGYYFVLLLIEPLCSSLIAYQVYKKKNNINIRLSRSLTRDYLCHGIPLTIGNLATILYMKFDQIMVGDLIGKTELGLYSVAVSFSELWFFVPTAICSSFYPKLSSVMEKANKEEVELVYKIFFRILFDVSVVASLIFSIVSSYIICLFYGSSYFYSGFLVKIYIWSSIFVCLGVARNSYIVFHNYYIFSTISTSIACVINIILNVIFLKMFGILGAAYSTIISYFVSAVLSSLFWKPMRRIGVCQFKAMFIPYVWIYRRKLSQLI